jgi:hypothetical protein
VECDRLQVAAKQLASPRNASDEKLAYLGANGSHRACSLDELVVGNGGNKRDVYKRRSKELEAGSGAGSGSLETKSP